MIFIGNPSFDHSITAPNCIGSYQVNGVQYGNGGGLTNLQPIGIAFKTSTAATTNTGAIWVMLSTNLTAGQQIWVLGVTNHP
jgi:hypothetical protein